MSAEKIEDYLGDGVYASHDGYHIILDLRGQDDTTRIALEPAVFGRLLLFRERVIEAEKDAHTLQAVTDAPEEAQFGGYGGSEPEYCQFDSD